MNDIAVDVERLARKKFKRQHPDRNWDLIATRRQDGFAVDSPHASEDERAAFRAEAREELLDPDDTLKTGA